MNGNNKTILRIGLVLLAWTAPLVTHAQSAMSSHIWTTLSYEFDLNDRTDLTFSGQYRTGSEFTFSRFLSEAQFSRKPNKNWKNTAEFRHYSIFDNQGVEQGVRQRLRLRLSTERRFKNIKGTLKFRGGVQHRRILTGPGGPSTTLRFRTAYEYPIKNFAWDPEFQFELFNGLNNDFERSLRMGIESSDKFSWGKVSVGYFYEHVFTNTSAHRHVLQLGYAL